MPRKLWRTLNVVGITLNWPVSVITRKLTKRLTETRNGFGIPYALKNNVGSKNKLLENDANIEIEIPKNNMDDGLSVIEKEAAVSTDSEADNLSVTMVDVSMEVNVANTVEKNWNTLFKKKSQLLPSSKINSLIKKKNIYKSKQKIKTFRKNFRTIFNVKNCLSILETLKWSKKFCFQKTFRMTR